MPKHSFIWIKAFITVLLGPRKLNPGCQLSEQVLHPLHHKVLWCKGAVLAYWAVGAWGPGTILVNPIMIFLLRSTLLRHLVFISLLSVFPSFICSSTSNIKTIPSFLLLFSLSLSLSLSLSVSLSIYLSFCADFCKSAQMSSFKKMIWPGWCWHRSPVNLGRASPSHPHLVGHDQGGRIQVFSPWWLHGHDLQCE